MINFKGLKGDYNKAILLLISINPIFDMIYTISNNIFKIKYGQFAPNQIFRIMFMLLLILNIKELKNFARVVCIGLYFIIGMIIQYALGSSINFITDLNLVSKLIYTLIIFIVILEMLKTNRIKEDKLLKALSIASIIIAISIIISPLGLGYESYKNSFGYKGLFYAPNFVSGCLLAMLPINSILYCGIRKALIVFINFCALMLIGSKASIFGGVLCIIIIISFEIFKIHRTSKRKINKKVLIISIVLMMIILGIVLGLYINQQIEYKSLQNYNFITYFTSNRNKQLEFMIDHYKYHIKNPIFTILFGMGNSGVSNVLGSKISAFKTLEQDFTGVFFYFGLIAFLAIVIFTCYIIIISFKNIKEDFQKNFMLFLSIVIMLVQSIVVGHVLYSALSSMFYSIIISVSVFRYSKMKNVYKVKT